MKCPTCVNTVLLIAEKQGIEIDYCPDCRGIWLDRGELEKIIERSANIPQRDESHFSKREKYENDDVNRHSKNHEYENHNNYNGKPYKKKSFLGDLFDF